MKVDEGEEEASVCATMAEQERVRVMSRIMISVELKCCLHVRIL